MSEVRISVRPLQRHQPSVCSSLSKADLFLNSKGRGGETRACVAAVESAAVTVPGRAALTCWTHECWPREYVRRQRVHSDDAWILVSPANGKWAIVLAARAASPFNPNLRRFPIGYPIRTGPELDPRVSFGLDPRRPGVKKLLMKLMVGVTGFEPATPTSRT
jgi:hypothetical protein